MKTKIIGITIGLLIFTTGFCNIFVSAESSDKNDVLFEDFRFDLKIRTLMFLANHGAISACIIKDNETIWSKSYGHSHIYLRRKATNQTIFGLGSITKTITATAILQLYEKGLINLSDDINKYLPFEIRNPNFPDIPITIKSLLTHRSSNQDWYIMTGEGRDELLKLYPFPDSVLVFLEELLIPGGKFYRDECWFDFPPDTKTAYSTMGFLIATAILENVTNQTIEEYCQENIFEPLEMKDTSFHPYSLDKKRIARPYLGNKIFKLPLFHYDAGCLTGGGGVRSTLEDLSHYLIANMNNGLYEDRRILNESTMKLMHNCTYQDEIYTEWHPFKHGYAWYETEEYGDKIIGHGGGAVGYDCMIIMNKTTNIGIVLLSTSIVSRILYKFNYVLGHDSRIKIIKILLEKADEIT